MKELRPFIIPLSLLALGAAPLAPPAWAATPARGAIATVGDRRVEEVDIRIAALRLAPDRGRARPTAWRRRLLDLCVGRELLAIEAARRGFPRDAAVQAHVREARARILRDALDRHVYHPMFEPKPEDLRQARDSRVYRRADLDLMVLPSTRAYAQGLADQIRAGASFDSIARHNAAPPASSEGGHVGWKLLRDLDPVSREAVKLATPGQTLGPLALGELFGIYHVRAFQEIENAELVEILREERRGAFEMKYPQRLLGRYDFAIDSAAVRAFLVAVAREPLDSLLSSLGSDGTRARRGSSPALGVLARVREDSVTAADLHRAGILRPARGGNRARLGSAQEVAQLCGAALIPRLLEREAEGAGLLREAGVLRQLRLASDEAATHAMVRKSTRSEPDSSALRGFYERHRERYRRGTRALELSEAAARVARDYQAEQENEWVDRELVRLRKKIPVRVVSARLEAVSLDEGTLSKGGGR